MLLSDLVPSSSQEIAPSVRALLATFQEETRQKLAVAPIDSHPVYQAADGSLCRVGEDGWIFDSDAVLDKADTITIQPTSVRDIEEPCDETLTQNGQRRPYGGIGVGNDEQLGLDFEVEQTEWGKWVDPDRRAGQVRKFLDYAGLQRIPSKPWPEGSAEVKRLNSIVAGLFPDMATAMAPENADMADAFICFIGECFIKLAGAKWVEFEWFGRENSFYDHVNPALLMDTYDEDVDTAWGLMDSMIDYHPEVYDGMFSQIAKAIREYAADHAEKRREEASSVM